MKEEDLETILDKLEIIKLRLDKIEIQQQELLTKFGSHIDFINETYEVLRNPIRAAKKFLGNR